MNDEVDLKAKYEREAARVNLRKMLDGKKRGDRITGAEVIKATGFDDWRSFGGPIHTWAKSAGFVLRAEVNDGWLIVPPTGHIDAAERMRQSAKRKEERVLKALGDTPVVELDESYRRRYEYQMVRAAARVQQACAHDKEIRKEFQLTDRVPLRSLTGGRS